MVKTELCREHSDFSAWRQPGQRLRKAIVEQDGSSLAIQLSNNCPLSHYLRVSDSVIDSFMRHPVESSEDLLEVYALGNRLIVFISSGIPKHVEYDFLVAGACEEKMMRVKSYLDKVALMIDERVHADHVGRILSTLGDEGSFESYRGGNPKIKIRSTDTSINLMLSESLNTSTGTELAPATTFADHLPMNTSDHASTNTSVQYSPAIYDTSLSENSILSKGVKSFEKSSPRGVIVSPAIEDIYESLPTPESAKKCAALGEESTQEQNNSSSEIRHYVSSSSSSDSIRTGSKSSSRSKVLPTKLSFEQQDTKERDPNPSVEKALTRNPDRSFFETTTPETRAIRAAIASADKAISASQQICSRPEEPDYKPLLNVNVRKPIDLAPPNHISATGKPGYIPVAAGDEDCNRPSHIEESAHHSPVRSSEFLERNTNHSAARRDPYRHAVEEGNQSLDSSNRSEGVSSSRSKKSNTKAQPTSRSGSSFNASLRSPRVHSTSKTFHSRTQEAQESNTALNTPAGPDEVRSNTKKTCSKTPPTEQIRKSLNRSVNLEPTSIPYAGGRQNNEPINEAEGVSLLSKSFPEANQTKHNRCTRGKSAGAEGLPSTWVEELINPATAGSVDVSGFPLLSSDCPTKESAVVPSKSRDSSPLACTSMHVQRDSDEMISIACRKIVRDIQSGPTFSSRLAGDKITTSVAPNDVATRSLFVPIRESESLVLNHNPSWVSWSDVEFEPDSNTNRSVGRLLESFQQTPKLETKEWADFSRRSESAMTNCADGKGKTIIAKPQPPVNLEPPCSPRLVKSAITAQGVPFHRRQILSTEGPLYLAESVETVQSIGSGTQLLLHTPGMSSVKEEHAYIDQYQSEPTATCLPVAFFGNRGSRARRQPIMIHSTGNASREDVFDHVNGVKNHRATPFHRPQTLESESSVELQLKFKKEQSTDRLNRRCRLNPLICTKHTTAKHDAIPHVGPVDLDDSALVKYDDLGYPPKRGCTPYLFGGGPAS